MSCYNAPLPAYEPFEVNVSRKGEYAENLKMMNYSWVGQSQMKHGRRLLVGPTFQYLFQLGYSDERLIKPSSGRWGAY